MEKVVPAPDIKTLLNRVVTAINWFFGAEQGGFFLFENDIKKANPQLLGAVNLTEIETASENFQPHIKLMKEAIRKNRPLLGKISVAGEKAAPSEGISVLCLPLNLPDGVEFHIK